MIFLKKPDVKYDLVIKKCKDGITGNPLLLKKLNDNSETLINLEEVYSTLGESGRLYSIDTSLKKDSSKIIDNLEKKELISLYNNYFRTKTKPARYLYDEILSSANEKCPFCGGIGRPRNLDHFVPKAGAPQFSILPLNLVPSCRDCNMDGKGDRFAETAEKQFIHPYLDKNIFFDVQWIFASYIQSDTSPNYIEYYVNPPEYWSSLDKKRALQHFQDFDIANRYSIEASSELPIIEAQIRTFIDKGYDNLNETLLLPIINTVPLVNHWKRVLYLALIEAV
tara:strand:+ start:14366 stop:15208 length:843 start_codon:yes stop_codon:yes gene_type:complete